MIFHKKLQFFKSLFEPRHEISINEVCTTSKASAQTVSSRLNIFLLLGYWPNTIWSLLALKEAAQAGLSLHLSKCEIDGNHIPRLIYRPTKHL